MIGNSIIVISHTKLAKNMVSSDWLIVQYQNLFKLPFALLLERSEVKLTKTVKTRRSNTQIQKYVKTQKYIIIYFHQSIKCSKSCIAVTHVNEKEKSIRACTKYVAKQINCREREKLWFYSNWLLWIL